MDERYSPLQHTVAILSRGDAAARRDSTPQNSRFAGVFEALATAGIDARPAIYDESFADELRDQLLTVDGVLVWVDPIHQGKTRAKLDLLLREVAKRGPWVSAHPDTILKMGEFQQHLAVMGQAELAAIVFEQSAAGQVFQPADLMGDRRLGAADLPAGGGKSSGIDDRDERPQQGDIEILVQ